MSRRDPLLQEITLAEMSPDDREDHERGLMRTAFGPYGELFFPSAAMEPILTPDVRAALKGWMTEMACEKELRAVGLKPRSRALLTGPPGCGKTTLAHHVAARIGIPLLVVQSTQIISKWVGQTGMQIGGLFKEARAQKGKVALFFDEFDSIADKRIASESAAGKEKNNMTIALLQEIDRFDGMLYAATNRATDIDPAIWRRFQLQIEVSFPGALERFAIVKMYLAPFAPEDTTVKALAAALSGASPALIKEACEFLRRTLALGPKLGQSTDLLPALIRFVASAQPAEGVPVPTLWSDIGEVEGALTSAPWPPALSRKKSDD